MVRRGTAGELRKKRQGRDAGQHGVPGEVARPTGVGPVSRRSLQNRNSVSMLRCPRAAVSLGAAGALG